MPTSAFHWVSTATASWSATWAMLRPLPSRRIVLDRGKPPIASHAEAKPKLTGTDHGGNVYVVMAAHQDQRHCPRQQKQRPATRRHLAASDGGRYLVNAAHPGVSHGPLLQVAIHLLQVAIPAAICGYRSGHRWHAFSAAALQARIRRRPVRTAWRGSARPGFRETLRSSSSRQPSAIALGEPGGRRSHLRANCRFSM